MTVRTIAQNVGKEHYYVAVSTAGSTSTAVSVVYDDAKVSSREELINCLRTIMMAINARDWPPGGPK